MVISPPVAPVSTTKSLPLFNLIAPPAKLISVPVVLNVVAAPFSRTILSPDAVVNVVAPVPKV